MDRDGSANRFAENGIEILEGDIYHDCGDIIFPSSNAQDAFAVIRNKIGEELKSNKKICCFGGDHSISYPVIDAFTEVYSNLHVLHLDAHADLYENFDDNPYSHASPFARLLEKGNIKSLTQVGIRTLNTHQRQQAAKYGVNVVEMKDFSYSFLVSLGSPLYISVDLDVLDPAFAPGISHHEPGGLSTRELITILQKINSQIVGADIVEYNPTRDINNVTAMVAYKIFKELVAKMVLS
jgi:agmatinase